MYFFYKKTFIISLIASVCFGVEPFEEAAIDEIQNIAAENGWSESAVNSLADQLRDPSGGLRIHDFVQGNVLTRFQNNPQGGVVLRDHERNHIIRQLQAHHDAFEAQVLAPNDHPSDEPGGGGIQIEPNNDIVLHDGSNGCPGLPNIDNLNGLIFEDLPPEIIEHIFSFMSVDDLRMLRKYLSTINRIKPSENQDIYKVLTILHQKVGIIPIEHYQLLSIPFDDPQQIADRQALNESWINKSTGLLYYQNILLQFLEKVQSNASVEELNQFLTDLKCDPLELFIYCTYAPFFKGEPIATRSNFYLKIADTNVSTMVYFKALTSLYLMLDASFRKHNPFWCVVVDLVLPHNQFLGVYWCELLPYVNYSLLAAYWEINHALNQDLYSYDHLGKSVFCYVLDFAVKYPVLKGICKIWNTPFEQNAIHVILIFLERLENFNMYRTGVFTAPVTADGLVFLEYAETLLDHPTHPLTPETLMHLQNNYPYELVPAVQGPAYNPYTQRKRHHIDQPGFLQNYGTRLSLFVLILSLLAGGYMSI